MKFLKFVLFFYLLARCAPQCCDEFAGWKCAKCPQGTHEFRGHCLFNIPKCSSYVDGFDCKQCEKGYELIGTQECKLIPTPKVLEESKEKTIKMDFQNLSGDPALAYPIVIDLVRTLHQ